MEKQVIISNPERLEEIKKKISGEGVGKFHVLADFDRTLTYGLSEDGVKQKTVIYQLRSDPKYLGEKYFEESNKLFEVYNPIEINPNISREEKQEKMQEWWEKHFDLLAKSGLSKEIMKRVVKEKPLKFRKGVKELLMFLDKSNIPTIFMSASPGDLIIKYLKEKDLLNKNVHVIANKYEFDKEGNAIKTKGLIIHVFNKKEVLLKDEEIYDKTKNRKNVLLLGDSIGDAGMIEGFPYDNLIKIGFLNEKVEESLEAYKEAFDVVLTGDQDFDYVNELIQELFN